MWIQVRSFDGKKVVRVDNLSKLTKVEELRGKLIEPFDAPAERQRLFYRGKQMEDGHSLFDYNVGLNDLIQIMVRNPPPTSTSPQKKSADTETKLTNGYASGEESDSSDKENQQPAEAVPTTSIEESMHAETGLQSEGSLFKIGDIVDARDVTMGAWFEAKIIKIRSAGPEDEKELKEDESSTSEDTTPVPKETESETKATLSKAENKDSEDKTTTDLTCTKSNNSENVESNDLSSTEKDATSETEPTSTTEQNSLTKPETNDKYDNSIEMDPTNIEKDNSSEMETEEPNNNINEPAVLKEIVQVEKKADLLEISSGKTGVETKVHVCDSNDGFVYSVQYEGYEDDDLTDIRSNHLRPRAKKTVKLCDVTVGQMLMVNYNYDEPDQRGYWYDCVVTAKRDTRTIKELTATLYLGKDLMPLENCKILFVYELFELEKAGTQINQTDVDLDPAASPVKRQSKPECDHCLDKPHRKCKFCACHTCGGKDNPASQILCDECDMAYHISCLDPPLEKIPDEDDWYCPQCKNDTSEVVKAGEKLKESKKKSKMASATATTSRDWGKGMACVGRTKQCNIVPPNHFGPIPGVEVGTQWKFRVQVSESGVHRPHVAGIHGREEEGAYSIVLSGGYEDDLDKGDEFMYTGSGGRDLSGNKRTAEQSCDQKLARMNRALAKNCNASIDNKTGAESKDWKGGKPVRVVRNCKGRKHSKFAPEEGNRYDGIYKIVKYWAEKGKSGFLVWRYRLRRDDPSAAPWTKAGKKRMAELGLEMQYPEGYLEAQKEKEEKQEITASAKKGKGRKRKVSETETSRRSSPEKKAKVVQYTVATDVRKWIMEDETNKKSWDEALGFTKEGGKAFLDKVEELFLCICCQELAYKPVTTECQHNICLDCLKRSFKAEVYTCPACRTELGKDYSMPVNKPLKSALGKLFPGYEAGR